MYVAHSNRFLIAQPGKGFGSIDRTGTVVIKPRFAFLGEFCEGLAYFEREGRRGLIDLDGREVFSFGPAIEEVKTFGEGLMPFRRGELWGYLDHNCQVAIEPQFDSAWGFEGGMACTETRRRRVFIDRSGAPLLDRPGTFIGGTFCEGLAAIMHRKKMGYIDRTGRRVILFRYLLALDFAEGLAAVKYSHPTVELGHLPGVAYSDTMSWVAGYIDHQGKHQFDTYYHDTDSFSEGLAAVQVTPDDLNENGTLGLHGYIDRTGSLVIEPQFSSAGKFSEGLAGVSTRKKATAGFTQGFINRRGELVISPRFGRVSPFCGGLAAVVYKRQDAYVNPAGDLVWVEGHSSE